MSLNFGESPGLDAMPRAAASRSRGSDCKNMHVLLLTAKRKAEKLSSYITTYGDESVNLQELSLKQHTLYLEKSPVLFVLSIENFSESVEGRGCKQMTPKLENKAFSAKSTQYIGLKHHKEPYNTSLNTYKRGM